MAVLRIKPPTETEKINFLKRIIKIFEENNIDYWLEFGTLLGCVRDHAFIKWDSDIDIGVFDLDKVRKLRDKFEAENLEVVEKEDVLTPCLRVADKLMNNPYFHADINEFLEHEGMYAYRWRIRRNIVCRASNYITLILREIPTMNAPSFQIKMSNFLLKIKKVMPDVLVNVLYKIFRVIDIAFSIDRTLLFNKFKTVKVRFYDMMVRIPDNAEEHLLLNYGKSWRTPIKVAQHGGDEFVRQVTRNGRQFCMLDEVRKT